MFAGVSDRVKLMVAFRRVGWKVKAHGESVAGTGNRDGITRCVTSVDLQSVRVCTVSLTGQISVTGQRPVFDRGYTVTWSGSKLYNWL